MVLWPKRVFFLDIGANFHLFPFLGVRSKNFGSCVVWCVKLHKYKCVGMFCGGGEALCGWCGVFL